MEDNEIEVEIDWEADFTACMHSVVLLSEGKPLGVSDEDWHDTAQRNVEHLKIMVAKTWPEDYDLTPFHTAIADNAESAS